MGLHFFSRNDIGACSCRALKDVGLRPTAFSDPPTQCGDPSPLGRTITPHITGGNAPLRRRLTTREAMAHPVELPLDASVQERPWTTRSSVRPVHSLRYTSRAENGLASQPPESRVASRAAATRAASVTAASSRPGVGRQVLLNAEKCGNLDQRRRVRTGAVLATCDSGWLLGGMLEAAQRRLEDQP
jgi:hypothetical protein